MMAAWSMLQLLLKNYRENIIFLNATPKNNDHISQYKKKYTFPPPPNPEYYVFKNKRSGTKYFSDTITLRIRIGVILEVLGEMSLTD